MKSSGDRSIPIRRGGKVVGYLNAPLRLRVWLKVKAVLQGLQKIARK